MSMKNKMSRGEQAHLWLALTMVEVVMSCGLAKNEHTTTDCSGNDASRTTKKDETRSRSMLRRFYKFVPEKEVPGSKGSVQKSIWIKRIDTMSKKYLDQKDRYKRVSGSKGSIQNKVSSIWIKRIDTKCLDQKDRH